MAYRDRIKSLRRVKASDLEENPKNWRTHPDSQKKAMSAALSEIGYADAVIARELPNKKLQIIDGHLRKGISGDEKIPVLVVDVTEDEADKLLATLDPLAAMAETDSQKMHELLKDMEGSSGFNDLLAHLADEHVDLTPPFEPVSEDEQGRLDEIVPLKCPSCGHEFKV